MYIHLGPLIQSYSFNPRHVYNKSKHFSTQTFCRKLTAKSGWFVGTKGIVLLGKQSSTSGVGASKKAVWCATSGTKPKPSTGGGGDRLTESARAKETTWGQTQIFQDKWHCWPNTIFLWDCSSYVVAHQWFSLSLPSKLSQISYSFTSLHSMSPLDSQQTHF